MNYYHISIVIKGARAMTFEKAILSLGFHKHHTTFIENKPFIRSYRYHEDYYTIELTNNVGSKYYYISVISPYTHFDNLYDIKHNDTMLKERWEEVGKLNNKLREMGFYPSWERVD